MFRWVWENKWGWRGTGIVGCRMLGNFGPVEDGCWHVVKGFYEVGSSNQPGDSQKAHIGHKLLILASASVSWARD